jgi:glycosyltransferase involved in cell wall biosynthesis
MSSPTVSVVMSVYNGQAFLAEAIESILGQTLREF